MIGYSSIHLLPFFKLLKPEEYVDILLKVPYWIEGFFLMLCDSMTNIFCNFVAQ